MCNLKEKSEATEAEPGGGCQRLGVGKMQTMLVRGCDVRVMKRTSAGLPMHRTGSDS